MKNKMAYKLSAYFSITLVLFLIVISFLFVMLFRSHIISFYKADMQKEASSIAYSISEYLNESGGWSRQGGISAYTKVLEDVTTNDVWIVDENLNFLVSGRGRVNQVTYSDLPSNAEVLVNDVFSGKTTFSEEFSGIIEEPTLTIGVPILINGSVKGAVLLHSSIDGMTESISQGISIMAISALSALAIAIILGIILSISFTNPLKKMRNAAISLSEKDYSAKTGVKQNDEIGQLASAIDQLSIQLDMASKESERLIQMKQDFMANISHELKTPVTVIRGSAEALCDKIITEPEQIELYHKQILNDSIMLQRLVEDLLELSRLQNTDFSVNKEKVNVCEVVSDAVHTARNLAKKKNIDVRFEMSESREIQGDYARLRQMFMVVLDNAIKFSNENGNVEVVCNRDFISIKDYGCGIKKEDMKYIFERFYKIDNDSNRTGTGLGLAIAWQIALRHDIEIEVVSEIGQGAEFKFIFKE